MNTSYIGWINYNGNQNIIPLLYWIPGLIEAGGNRYITAVLLNILDTSPDGNAFKAITSPSHIPFRACIQFISFMWINECIGSVCICYLSLHCFLSTHCYPIRVYQGYVPLVTSQRISLSGWYPIKDPRSPPSLIRVIYPNAPLSHQEWKSERINCTGYQSG